MIDIGSGERKHLPEDMVEMWRNWSAISDYIVSGGERELPSTVKWLDMPIAQNLFSVLKPTSMLGPKNTRSYHSFSSRPGGYFLPSPRSAPSLLVGFLGGDGRRSSAATSNLLAPNLVMRGSAPPMIGDSLPRTAMTHVSRL